MPDVETTLPPAAAAFEAIASGFDARFGGWQSVAAQRAAVRSFITSVVAPGSRLLELGGGTGEDARWLAERGYRVTMTDPSPTMVAIAAQKLSGTASTTEILSAEELDAWVQTRPDAAFDGAFSNFAALNCVQDLSPVARGLAQALKPGAAAILVLFGPFSPGELVVQLLRGSRRGALRRLQAGPIEARLGGRAFPIVYHRPRQLQLVFAPWFDLMQRRGIGVFLPPSAAEPGISLHPRLLRLLALLDQVVTRPLALLGDHVLYYFVRNSHQVGDGSRR